MPNPAPAPAAVDTAGRAVNAAVVILALAIALLAYWAMAANKDTVATTSALFGSFTTLVGTAVAAYFGINATRDVANTSGAQLADANSKLGAVHGKLAAINSVVSNADPAASHPASDAIRQIIAS